MKLTAPKRACEPCELAPLAWCRWASMTRSRICSTALTARGSRSRYLRSRLGTERPWAEDLGPRDPPFAWDPGRRARLRAELGLLPVGLVGSLSAAI